MRVLVKVLLLLAAGSSWRWRLCGGESYGTFRLSCGSDPAHPVEREEERRKSGQEGGEGGGEGRGIAGLGGGGRKQREGGGGE